MFVSYSHRDRVYLSDGELVSYLKGLEKEGVRFWWDESLNAGDNWDEEIKRRIKESHLALVLVSQWFLDSDYCTNVEVESFLRRSREDGLVIFPVILSPCEWERHDWLKSRQFLPREGKTVETDYVQPGQRKALYLDIRRDLRAQLDKIRGPKGDLTTLVVKQSDHETGSKHWWQNRVLQVVAATVILAALSLAGYKAYQRYVNPPCELSDADKERVKKLGDNIENNLRHGATTNARMMIGKVRDICSSYPALAEWEKKADTLERSAAPQAR